MIGVVRRLLTTDPWQFGLLACFSNFFQIETDGDRSVPFATASGLDNVDRIDATFGDTSERAYFVPSILLRKGLRGGFWATAARYLSIH